MTEATEHHVEHKIEERSKEGFDFKKWLKGSGKRDYIENISFIVIVISSVMISIGIGLGSFIQGTIFIAVFGAFFVMIGIAVYVVSQFMGE